jgi:ribokinase
VVDVCVLGSLNADVVTRVVELPRPGETVFGLSLNRYPGGKGLNQAIAAARLGASVAMLGCIGADEPGQMLKGVLEADGVDTSGLKTASGLPTGQAHICVSASAENMIVVTPGANAQMDAVDGVAVASLAPRVALCQFETPRAALDSFLGASSDALRIVNAAPAMAEQADLFRLADIVVVNETELASYSGMSIDPDDRDAVVRAAASLLSSASQTIVVTLGAAGTLAIGRDRTIIAPGRPAIAVDTTGAGDCFCGALAASLAGGASLEDALVFANRAASISVEREGAASSMPTLAEVQALS